MAPLRLSHYLLLHHASPTATPASPALPGRHRRRRSARRARGPAPLPPPASRRAGTRADRRRSPQI
ncbi:hypothetical protein ACP4OV_009087 [Aristida adscensionis]